MYYRSKSIQTLLRHHPWSEDVLGWYGVDIERVDPSASLETVCWLHRLDPAQVVADLVATENAQQEAYPSLLMAS